MKYAAAWKHSDGKTLSSQVSLFTGTIEIPRKANLESEDGLRMMTTP
jgi:hypothetical protein